MAVLNLDRNIQLTLKMLNGYSDQRAATVYGLSKSRARAIFYKTIKDAVPGVKYISSIKALRATKDEIIPYVEDFTGGKHTNAREALKSVEDSIEQLDNLLAALNLSIPDHTHVTALKDALPELSDKLKASALLLGGEAFWEM